MLRFGRKGAADQRRPMKVGGVCRLQRAWRLDAHFVEGGSRPNGDLGLHLVRFHGRRLGAWARPCNGLPRPW